MNLPEICPSKPINQLFTIIRSQVMVFDQGNLVEYDRPVDLLNNPQSFLRSLLERTGNLGIVMMAADQYQTDTDEQ